MPHRARARLSYAEYLELEERSDVKHEFVDGELYAMSGGTPAHARLPIALAVALDPLLRGGPCRLYSSDLRVRFPDGNSAYPDLSVVCGELETDALDHDAATNPTAIIEVLSDSTEGYDRGAKLHRYRTFPSLRHYLLVAQHAVCIEHYERRAGGEWTHAVHGPGDALVLTALGAELRVDEVYEDVELADPPPHPGVPFVREPEVPYQA